MTEVTRKDFLRLLGTGGIAMTIAPGVLLREAAAYSTPPVTPVRVPHPLSIYERRASFLPTGLNGAGETVAAGVQELASYTTIDDLVVPPECERYVIVQWGDLIFGDGQSDDYFGYNNDFTAYVPINGNALGWLVVNHEYISYPFHQYAPGTPSRPAGYPAGPLGRSFEQVIGDKIGLTLPDSPATTQEKTLLWGEMLYNCGLSIIHIVLAADGHYKARKRKNNRRITGLSGLALNSSRGYPTSWGSQPHQQGNDDYLLATGPAARQVFPNSSDGLGNKVIGTFANCSGGQTPWGTTLSCEENFQGDSGFYLGVTETVKPDGTQTGYTAGTSGELFGLVGEKYGWVVEVFPASPDRHTRKLTALGRFRHENLAMRTQVGGPVICYMGDDRRGGHWWKFVSGETISDLHAPSNSNLFNRGTLYVAKFDADGTGRWIPLTLGTPTNPNNPTVLGSVQLAQQGSVDRNGLVKLPLRLDTPAVPAAPGVTAVTPADGGWANVDMTNQDVDGLLDFYRDKHVSDFYTSLGAALCDAYAAANLIGGTPCARPEDCEVDPVTHDIYMSNTDARPSGDGYPDSRIFVVGKYQSPANTAQQFGDLLKVTEDSADGTGTTFTWTRLSQGGEYGTQADSNAQTRAGDGFGNSDNLTFGADNSLWICIDQSTELHNGFRTGLVMAGGTLTETTIDHAAVGSSAAEGLIGVFGNNWLFHVPTSGPDAGVPVPFAIGPTRCEMTGPTFVGNTLVVSIQHPGEDCSIRETAAETQSRTIDLLAPTGGGLFSQTRTINKGSQWPSNIAGVASGLAVPIPVVVGIRRKDGKPIT